MGGAVHSLVGQGFTGTAQQLPGMRIAHARAELLIIFIGKRKGTGAGALSRSRVLDLVRSFNDTSNCVFAYLEL